MVVQQDVPIRDAATVVLLRDGPSGVEAWLLTRVREMVFAAGMSVFPGGRVDPADVELPFPPGAAAGVAQRFGCSEEHALALLGAAVRETFEETGVLLSRPGADLSGARSDVESGRVSFGDLLRANGLTVDAAGLRPWARWITPPGETPRRYDTRFFVAALPDGASAQDVTTESSTAGWVPVADAVRDARQGRRLMLPPTIVTLASIAPFGSVADVLAASPQRGLDAISPTISLEGERVVASLPDGVRVELPKSMFR